MVSEFTARLNGSPTVTVAVAVAVQPVEASVAVTVKVVVVLKELVVTGDPVLLTKSPAGSQEKLLMAVTGGVKVYTVPLGRFALEVTLNSTALLAVEALAGESGVTLKKLPVLPEIPIDAVGLDKAALVAPYTNCITPVASYSMACMEIVGLVAEPEPATCIFFHCTVST